MERSDCKDLVGHGRSLGFILFLAKVQVSFNEKVKAPRL